ncbi:hypothetical protein IAG41_20360 [Sphingomonas sp. JC676]|uniref:hypothetical protein n=1 Tax=Sphingomonas sp. JC676 TaxID=2768065 RepID=UPI001657C88B|nr:hypothetical protein [Sphingomonas sp. JC676]MBC9034750.1 hypothetical protein [Sphingomonas sp. JC676]
MNAKLTLRYEFSSDDGDFGWLAAEVETYPFSGRGGFWVQWQDVEAWAGKLGSYPISTENPCVAEWGQCQSDGSNYEVIIGVSILPANKTGDLDVLVKVGDLNDARQQCQAVFRTNYPDTARFAAEMQAMMRRETNVARLLGRNVD